MKKIKNMTIAILSFLLFLFYFLPYSEAFDLSGTWVLVENESQANNSVSWIELFPDNMTDSAYNATFNQMTKTSDEYGNERTQDRRYMANGILRINGDIGILNLRHIENDNREYRAELVIDVSQMKGTCRSFRNGFIKNSQPCIFERCDIRWSGMKWYCR